MKNPQFLKDTAMTTDIVMHPKKASMFLQKNSCSIADCQEVVKSTVTSLEKLKQKQVLFLHNVLHIYVFVHNYTTIVLLQ
jgi:hypothetical protein